MINKNFKGYKVFRLVIITGILLGASNLRAEEPAVSGSFSNGTKEYLSDPARTGSLVGTILAGATLANPLAPLIGSLAGFVIGKNSDYSDKRRNSQQSAYSSRSFIPKNDIPITSLTGLTGKPLQEIEQTGFRPQTQAAMTVIQQEETRQPVIVELTQETGEQGSRLQLQLGSACSNITGAERLPAHCYYYSQ